MCDLKTADWTCELFPQGKLANSGITMNLFKVEPPMVSDWTGEAYSTVQVTETTTPDGRDETHILGVHAGMNPLSELGDDIHMIPGRDFLKGVESMGYVVVNRHEARHAQ